jgi:ectoine hydroxylase-related dioxygenase (phytanoyl-CoA dioxygenase family)
MNVKVYNFKNNELNSNGYIKLSNQFDKVYIDKLNDLINNLVKDPSKYEKEHFFIEKENMKVKQIQYLYDKHIEFQILKDKMLNFAKTKIFNVNSVDELEVINMQLFEKYRKPTRPHQDNGYFMLDNPEAVTFWLALDDISVENGCICYSKIYDNNYIHHHDRYSKFTTFRVRSGVKGLSLHIPGYNEANLKPIPVNSGDLLIHSCMTVHTALPNLTETKRRRAIGIAIKTKNAKVNNKLYKEYQTRLNDDCKLKMESTFVISNRSSKGRFIPKNSS